VDSNYGMAMMSLFSLDPAVRADASGMKVDPRLDLWNPQNGFDPKGARYTPEFTRAFQSGVAQRETRLIADAQGRLAKIQSGQGDFADDETLVIAGASYNGLNNKFFSQDVRFLSHTRKPWPLLHKDGSVTTEIVHTVRVPENMKPTTPSWADGALKTTVRRFLANVAVRVEPDFAFDEDTIRGVDWASAYSIPQSSVRNVKVPLLTLGMTGHWEFLAAEGIYENAASPDKTIAFVEGATHLYTPCKPCEKTPGQFGDTVKTTYDYVDAWLSKPGRF
jgi:hypothetical protein